MKTVDEFKHFYESMLLPSLEVLERKRIKIKHYIYLAMFLPFVIGWLILMLSFLYYIFKNKGLPFAFTLFVLAFLLYLFCVHKVTDMFIKNLSDKVKGCTIKPIINYKYPGFNYQPLGYIDREEFNKSGIFNSIPRYYKGENLVLGKVQKVQFKFAEIQGAYQTRSKIAIDFKCLCFIADFNKQLSGQTFVLPDIAERTMGRFGQYIQEWKTKRGELVKLEDPEFEKHFVVYSSDQIEARYVLTTNLMRRIVKFRQKAGSTVLLSFIGSSAYIIIPYMTDLFKVSIHETLLNYKEIERYYKTLQFLIGIVEDLNLNTRIWTKR